MVKRIVVMCIYLAIFSVTKTKSIDVAADVIADANALLQALASLRFTRSSAVALEDYNQYDEADVVVEPLVLDYETAFETDRLASSRMSSLHGTGGAMSSSSLTGSSDVALDDYNDAKVFVEASVLDYETAFETDRPVVATPPFRVLFRTSSMKFDIDGWSNGVELPTSYDCPPRIDRYATTRALRQTRSA